MSALAAAAQDYLQTMTPTAARVSQDLNLHHQLHQNHQNQESLLWYFRGCGGQKTIRDEASGRSFRDEHSAPFTFRSNSQIDLIAAMEPPPPAVANLAEQTQMNRELVLSHCRVLSELKNALKTDLKHTVEAQEPVRAKERISEDETDVALPRRADEDAGFISKLLGNKKFRGGNSGGEEREQLVSSEKRCQIVASSDNYFKTNFGGLHRDVKDSRGHEESKALLPGSLQDSLAASTDSEFLSCEETPVSVASPSSPDFALPKTGYDFLDNW